MTSRQHPGLSDPALSETILHSIGALIVVLDHDANIVRFNEACEEATGWTRDEVLGLEFFELLVPPEERDAVRQVFERLLAGDFPCRYENDLLRKDGSRVTVAWSNTCTLDEVGHVALVVGTGTDLSKQRAAEAAFSALVECTPNVAIQIYDRDGTVVVWNPASTRLYGWTAHEVMGRTGGETFLAGSPFDELRAAIASIERDGRPIGPAVFPARHRDGREVLALSTVFRIPGAPGARFVCMDVDVTATVRMQNALRVAAGSATSDGLFLALTTQLAAAIGWRYGLAAVIDPDGLTAHTRAMVVDGVDGGPLSYSLLGSPCAGVVECGLVQYPTGVARLFPEDAFLDEMGIEAYIGSPLRGSNGRALGVLVLMNDRPSEATEEQRSLMELFASRLGAELERERAEYTVRSLNAELELRVAARTAELDAANAELQAFSYSVSHDLRAPVRAIAGFAEALEEDHGALLPPDGRLMLSRIHAAGVRMGHLIDDLLGLSRISRQTMQIAPVALSGLWAKGRRERAPWGPGRDLGGGGAGRPPARYPGWGPGWVGSWRPPTRGARSPSPSLRRWWFTGIWG